MRENINRLLSENNCSISVALFSYEGAHLLASEMFSFEKEPETSIFPEFNRSKWEVGINIRKNELSEGSLDFCVKFRLLSGNATGLNLGVRLDFSKWSADNYILMPAGVYNGNRFQSRKAAYPPILRNKEDQRTDIPTIITDVPRLNIGEGLSRIQLISRDLSTPAAGFYSPRLNSGFWLLTGQETALGDTGIAIEENESRDSAFIELTAPGMRRDFRYTICDNEIPSEDKAADFQQGDEVELDFRLYFFKCNQVQCLFDKFTAIRKDLSGQPTLKHELPFSAAWKLHEEKYNREKWEERLGYYSVGLRENMYQDWQIGWVGGLMVTQPLLQEGSDISRTRAVRNFDFVFNGGQGPSGFFHGCGHNGKWFGDNFDDPTKKWHLIRKSSDALYFAVRQFMLMEELGPCLDKELTVKKEWQQGIQRCADAFVTMWNKYGQFGQIVDIDTGELIVGNSCCAAIAPAGLALAAQYFNRKDYIETAERAAEYFYENFTKKGISTGGPGEILQCPDSESAFGLLESYIVLYEVTGSIHWLEKAKCMANQCITWCVSYDFRFPPLSTMGKLDMRTTGTVYASVQNKHSAPGICTQSGISLFKLYRYTGNTTYLELLREIAHSIPQYMSRKDKPICAVDGRTLPEGWINERVEMSDWLEPIGEIFYGSCWSEVSDMLTYAEIPGIYLQTDTGMICVIEHVEAELTTNDSEKLKLKISNTTKYEAEVKIFAERSVDTGKILGQNSMLRCQKVKVAPMSSKELLIENEGDSLYDKCSKG